MLHYLKHGFMAIAYLATAAVFVLAPRWSFLVAVFMMALYLLVDLGTPPDTSVPIYRRPWILDSYLYLHLPESAACLGALLWIAAPGDLWGVGQWLHRQFGLDFTATSGDRSWVTLLVAAVSLGFLLSTNTVVAHELVHRTRDRFALFVGRWMLALVGDAQFSISHVYGHHINVATRKDPATARRGESIYVFVLRSTIGQYREAWELESRRLRGRPWFVRLGSNKIIGSGLAMTAAVAVAFFVFAGIRGLVAYALVVVTSKLLFETVNYIEHYGLVRVPGTPVEPRHSWDCRSRAGSNILLNLTRHAHHHADARVKYWALRSIEGAPDLPYGYFGHILLSLIPPLWHHLAAPPLFAWDETMATPGECELARQANRESQCRAFVHRAVPAPKRRQLN
jgi:fatty acid desaturase